MRRPCAPLLLAGLAAVVACGEGSPGAVEPSTGGIDVTTVTSGSPADPDGYLLALDNGSRAIGSNTTLAFTDLQPGDHRLELRGIAANCTLVGPNPRTVTVQNGPPAQVRLQVTCLSDLGAISIRTRTAGTSPDPDGYSVAVDDAPEGPIGSNGELTLTGITLGSHTLALSGVAANCVVQGGDRQTVTVSRDAPTTVVISIACHGGGPGTLLLTSNRSGEPHIYRIEPDGSGLVDLTPGGAALRGDWSPHRSRIVFDSPAEEVAAVYVMDADGGNRTRLTAGASPVWSPDGSRIAFTAEAGVTIMNADGSDPRVLTDGKEPAWSPDGARLAFSRARCVADICGSDLFVINADGSGERELVQGSPFDTANEPSWSPDGRRIVFTRRCCFLGDDANGLYTVPSDAPPFTLSTLLHRGDLVGRPVWAPDGSAIAFGEQRGHQNIEVMIMPATGGEAHLLVASPGADSPSSWK